MSKPTPTADKKALDEACAVLAACAKAIGGRTDYLDDDADRLPTASFVSSHFVSLGFDIATANALSAMTRATVKDEIAKIKAAIATPPVIVKSAPATPHSALLRNLHTAIKGIGNAR